VILSHLRKIDKLNSVSGKGGLPFFFLFHSYLDTYFNNNFVAYLIIYTAKSINYTRFQERQFCQPKVFLEMLGSFFEYVDKRAPAFVAVMPLF
jgi:hypothetical protein